MGWGWDYYAAFRLLTRLAEPRDPATGHLPKDKNGIQRSNCQIENGPSPFPFQLPATKEPEQTSVRPIFKSQFAPA
uniref:Uncharacterized protein n=1 Tax=Anguilla anguilla TaxID=7936 RepID=A0A0E9PTH2_ANGAN